jgi:LAO/AO transport system kinase
VSLKLKDYIEGFKQGDTTVLAQAITLIESQKDDHKKLALQLLSAVKNINQSVILGISGTPGVGKSTFIETFGLELIKRGKKIAVLAVDPSSGVTGGSILGDKTRMQELSQKAFIRPSPSGKTLGGVALKTREAILLCESFGFDYILIETVGVGQSESQIASLVDHFILLMQPGAGDDLQAIKRGILEHADSIIVNKADGDLVKKANITKAQLESSLDILRQKNIHIHLVSALKKQGISEFVDELFKEANSHDFFSKRESQEKLWIEQILEDALIEALEANKKYHAQKLKLIDDVYNNNESIEKAVEDIVKGLSYGN